MKALAVTQGSKIRINAILPGLLLTEWASLPFVVEPDSTNLRIGREFHARAAEDAD